jgi:peptide alpha-N-acetyltransferase
VRNEESSASSVSKSGKRHVKPVDPDPNGEKLLQVTSISYCFPPLRFYS